MENTNHRGFNYYQEAQDQYADKSYLSRSLGWLNVETQETMRERNKRM